MLWLISGGSVIAVAVLAAAYIRLVAHSNLTVTLTDERYGPVDHPDSNWGKLIRAGFYLPQARLLPVLNGHDLGITTTEFDSKLRRELSASDFALGFFGMGADGHTAGILPASPAVSAQNYAVGYDWTDFKRITMTSAAIARLDEAILYAVGQSKWPAIARLGESHKITQQPAQSLKKVPKLTVYTDYKGEI